MAGTIAGRSGGSTPGSNIRMLNTKGKENADEHEEGDAGFVHNQLQASNVGRSRRASTRRTPVVASSTMFNRRNRVSVRLRACQSQQISQRRKGFALGACRRLIAS